MKPRGGVWLWNFTKFLVAGDGQALARYAAAARPEALAADIGKALGPYAGGK